MGGNTAREEPKYPRYVAGPVGKKIASIYEERLKQFDSPGQYEKNGLLAKLYDGRATGEPAVKLSVYSPPDLSRPTFEEATSSHNFRPAKIGESFGPSWSTHWFRIELQVPRELRDANHLEFHWDAGNEGLVWSSDGEPLQGLTGGGERIEWILPKSFRDGKTHIFYIEMACNKMFGNPPGDVIQPPLPDIYYQLVTADIVSVNLDARALKIDFWIIGDAAREFPKDSWEEHQALMVANEIMECFIAGDGSHEAIRACRKIAQKYLGKKVDSEDVYGDKYKHLVTAVGHCHIDTCWLWPWAETKRKIARSWGSQCDLMDRYPEHRFVCSSAQQYAWLEQYYPKLFDRVKTKVKEGKFQPTGGSWVEHDTNMPSGESLVRQFLYGQRFFESRFGERSTTFWLPDTFGYSPQLPQICRIAGMSRFFTQKLSWNNINSFPHTTFNWVSLDGSQVLCHMAPAETYTAEAHFGDVVRSITQHKSLDQDATSILPFGKGDGGGGPTWEHLEKLRRCRGLSETVGRLAPVHVGNSVDDFFAGLEEKAKNGTKYVTWYGELYFELHRGTYTTQSNNKFNNRKAEIMLRDLEYLATFATIKHSEGGSGAYKYPKKELDEMWEGVLLCQFHDCLPGSCIEMCYDDSDKLYEKIFKTGEKLINEAMHALGFKDATTGRESESLVAVDTLTHERLLSPESDIKLLEDAPIPAPSNAKDDTPVAHQLDEDLFELSNARFSVKVSSGTITSIYDKFMDREVVAEGQKANQLVLFDDKPLYWQAWDVEVYHIESRKELKTHSTSIVILDNGHPAIQTKTRISEKSFATTTMSLVQNLDPKSRRGSRGPYLIDFSCEISWHEDKKFLKVEFPVDVHNTEASYEMQYGYIKRPTHYNTSWDMAKFEVCCHKWADLSDYNYGVSILNDCKYGFATVGNVMRLSLLRAPKAPDAHADMGTHHLRYAIYPHDGALGIQTVKLAREFNSPIVHRHGVEKDQRPLFPYTNLTSYIRQHDDPDGIKKFLSSIQMSLYSSPSIVIDCIKRGEDDEDISRGILPARKGRSIIVRLYDSMGGRVTGRVSLGSIPATKVTVCNALEDDGEEVAPLEFGEVQAHGRRQSSFKVMLKAFEVKTYRVWLKF